MFYQPSEYQIRATMQRIGCDYLQARNHLIGAQRAREMAERQRRDRYESALRSLMTRDERIAYLTASTAINEAKLADALTDGPTGLLTLRDSLAITRRHEIETPYLSPTLGTSGVEPAIVRV